MWRTLLFFPHQWHLGEHLHDRHIANWQALSPAFCGQINSHEFLDCLDAHAFFMTADDHSCEVIASYSRFTQVHHRQPNIFEYVLQMSQSGLVIYPIVSLTKGHPASHHCCNQYPQPDIIATRTTDCC